MTTKEELDEAVREVAKLKEMDATSQPAKQDDGHRRGREGASSLGEKMKEEHWRVVERRGKLRELNEDEGGEFE